MRVLIMIYELRHYEFTPSNWEKYLRLFNEVCLPIRQNNFGVLKGKWITSKDDMIHFYHLWEYSSLDTRKKLRDELNKIIAWQEVFIKNAVPLIENQEIKILNPFLELQDFNFNKDLKIHELKCKVGKIKSIMLPLTDSHQNNIQINVAEFPNPNELIFLSDKDYNVGNLDNINIKEVNICEVSAF